MSRLRFGALLAGLVVVACVPHAAATAPVAAPSPLERQWALAAEPSVKIEVRRDAWYRVAGSRLKRAGVDLSSPGRLHLYADGREVPIQIGSGGISFYGQGRDTPTTDARTYWLTRGATGGRRIATTALGRWRQSRVARSFPYTLERKFRTTYTSLATGERQNFFGPQIYSEPTTFGLAVHDVAQSTGVLEVVAQGLSKRSHQMTAMLNGSRVGTMAFSGQTLASRLFALPRGVLREGANSLTLTSVGGDADVSFIDTVRVTYPRFYRAEQNSLRFSLARGAAGRVLGFTRRDVTVVDVTNQRSPKLVRTVVRRAGNGFAVLIGSAPKARRLLAFASTARPALIARNRPSSWHGSGGAELVIISYRAFLPQLARLKAYHERQGLKVALVDVEDLYDEFTYGMHDPAAIKAFLARAQNEWHPAPRYVILAGDATSDPRNYLHAPARDFVPTKTIDTVYMEAASDDWFGDFNDDGLPELAVGRLPVRTAAEAATVVDKIIGYESGPTLPSRQALLVSDTGFEPATNSLRALLPSSLTAVTVNRRDGPTDAAVHRRILDVLNTGPSVVNYYGHGAIDIWTGAPLFKSADVSTLGNGGRLSLYVMMTCLNGYFIEPKTQSLAEALLRAPNGGAFAVWASSALTESAPQVRANEELFRQLRATTAPRLGDAMVHAKSVIGDPDVRRTWILFGDPLTHLR